MHILRVAGSVSEVIAQAQIEHGLVIIAECLRIRDYTQVLRMACVGRQVPQQVADPQIDKQLVIEEIARSIDRERHIVVGMAIETSPRVPIIQLTAQIDGFNPVGQHAIGMSVEVMAIGVCVGEVHTLVGMTFANAELGIVKTRI